MSFTRKRVLITTKTHADGDPAGPVAGSCGGIDIDRSEWVRLSPVPLADLDVTHLRKYTIVDVPCREHPGDLRPGSLEVDWSGMKPVRWVHSMKKWRQRGEALLPTASESLCQMMHDGCSLGLFKPKDVEFSWTALEEDPARPWPALAFLDKGEDAPQTVPYDFFYEFRCAGQDHCPGHRLPLLDWELGQDYRNWRHCYKPDSVLLDMIRQEWLSKASPRNDVYFFAGARADSPRQYMALGVFHPSIQGSEATAGRNPRRSGGTYVRSSSRRSRLYRAPGVV